MSSSQPAPIRRYAVFISYRHADNKEMGRKWANWLHEALEGYEIPPDLVGTLNMRGEKVPPSLCPVFRDEEEFPADADLSTNISGLWTTAPSWSCSARPGPCSRASWPMRFAIAKKSERAIPCWP